MKATTSITSTIFVIVFTVSVHSSAQHSDNIPRIKNAYNAIMSEGGDIDHLYNPILLTDTLAYLERVLQTVSSANPLFQQFKPVWDSVGIMIYHGQEDRDIILKASKNGLFISFFDPAEMYEMMETQEDLFISSFYPELSIIEVPNPRSFQNLDVFAMLLAHETTHAVARGYGQANSEVIPYIIETMVFIQYTWGKQLLNQLVELYKQEKRLTYRFVSTLQESVPQRLSKIENAALVGYLMLAAPLMVEQPQTYTGFVDIIHAYNVYMSRQGFREYKVESL